MLRRSVLLGLAGLTALPALGTGASALGVALTPEEQQLISEINTHNSAIRTMAGRFEQIDSQGKRLKGTFYLVRPNRIRFRYAPPSREEIISVGNGFYVIDRQEKTQYAYPQDRVPLREFLTDDINLLKANIIDVVTSDNFVSVTLSDDTPIGTVEVALIFDKASKDLKQWTLTEPSGAELTFSIYDIVKNQDIPTTMFRIDPTYSAPNN